ncbi:hypothetical protein HD806DRAFT_516321 [Xylariaceae sp. AK1471]|nr:hypothetical protein HD806DRAFT_516321 [Xylariaceae sp. AK1471]
MERAKKRHKICHTQDRDENFNGVSDGHARTSESPDASIQHHGDGISSVDSNVVIGRDYQSIRNIQNFYSNVSSRSAASNNLDVNGQNDQRKIVLNTLRFSHSRAREMYIREPRTGTCQWILETPEYIDWLDENHFAAHNGLLWIKGKPGAGKSTLMSFTLAQTRQVLKDTVIISFFFNARGGELEKSTSGLYRSLLVQLFDACPDLHHLLDHIPKDEQWNIESLENLFKRAILAMGACSPICFIDALDECDESEIRRMLGFFQDVSEQALLSGIKLHTCLTSRYYPNITVKKGLIVRLEDKGHHQDDISRYLDSSLNIGHSALAEEIRRELQRKASGVFMWVVLVVNILNQEYDAGRPDRLHERLQEIPDGLHDLFYAMLTRDRKNMDGLLCCIQWISFSRRPLSPKELYFAILSGVDGDRLSACHSEEISTQDMERYILNTSKGLVEFIKASDRFIHGRVSTSVQFIHEAVRDFLLKERGFQKVWDEIGSNIQGQSHEKLKSCCLTYMKFQDVQQHCMSTSTLKEVVPRFLFSEYACQHILEHAEMAEGYGVDQSNFLSQFPTQMWTQLQHQNQSDLSRQSRYTSTATLLYILAEENLPSLIRAHPFNQSCFAVEDQQHGTPMFAALSTRSGGALQALYEVQARRMQSDSDSRAILQKFTGLPYLWELCDDFVFVRERGVNYYIVQLGDALLYELFFATEKDAGSRDLFLEAKCGSTKHIRTALENGANVNIRNDRGDTLLHSAIDHGNEAVVRLLLDNGANTNIQNDRGDTPLHDAACIGDEAIIRLLLDNGANTNIENELGGTPLSPLPFGFHKESTKKFILQLLSRGRRSKRIRKKRMIGHRK